MHVDFFLKLRSFPTDRFTCFFPLFSPRARTLVRRHLTEIRLCVYVIRNELMRPSSAPSRAPSIQNVARTPPRRRNCAPPRGCRLPFLSCGHGLHTGGYGGGMAPAPVLRRLGVVLAHQFASHGYLEEVQGAAREPLSESRPAHPLVHLIPKVYPH